METTIFTTSGSPEKFTTIFTKKHQGIPTLSRLTDFRIRRGWGLLFGRSVQSGEELLAAQVAQRLGRSTRAILEPDLQIDSGTPRNGEDYLTTWRIPVKYLILFDTIWSYLWEVPPLASGKIYSNAWILRHDISMFPVVSP